MMTLSEISLHDETEILLSRLHLQNRSVIITEMIICPLPEVRMRSGRNGKSVSVDVKALWFASPLEEFDIDLAIVDESIGHSVNK